MTISVVVSPTPPDVVAVGSDGKSAYQVAVDNGFVGTEAEWLASLQADLTPEERQEIADQAAAAAAAAVVGQGADRLRSAEEAFLDLVATMGDGGFYYDLRRNDTLFQNLAGLRVTEVDQPLGLILDLSKRLTLGSNAVANPFITGNTTGWTLGTGWAKQDSWLYKTAGTASNLTTPITKLALRGGRMAKISYTLRGVTGSFTPSIIGATTVTGATRTADGIYSDYVILPENPATLSIDADAAASGGMDDVTVQEVLGNHLYEPVSTRRFSYWIDPDTNEPMMFWPGSDLPWPGTAMKTMNAGSAGTLCIAATDSPFIADAVIAAYLPPSAASVYAFFDRRLTDAEVQVVKAYFDEITPFQTDKLLGYTLNGNIDMYATGPFHAQADARYGPGGVAAAIRAQRLSLNRFDGTPIIGPDDWTEEMTDGTEGAGLVQPRTRLYLDYDEAAVAQSGVHMDFGTWYSAYLWRGAGNAIYQSRSEYASAPYDVAEWTVPLTADRLHDPVNKSGGVYVPEYSPASLVDSRLPIIVGPGSSTAVSRRNSFSASLSTEVDLSAAVDVVFTSVSPRVRNGQLLGLELGNNTFPKLRRLRIETYPAVGIPDNVPVVIPSALLPPSLVELRINLADQRILGPLDLSATQVETLQLESMLDFRPSRLNLATPLSYYSHLYVRFDAWDVASWPIPFADTVTGGYVSFAAGGNAAAQQMIVRQFRDYVDARIAAGKPFTRTPTFSFRQTGVTPTAQTQADAAYLRTVAGIGTINV